MNSLDLVLAHSQSRGLSLMVTVDEGGVMVALLDEAGGYHGVVSACDLDAACDALVGLVTREEALYAVPDTLPAKWGLA